MIRKSAIAASIAGILPLSALVAAMNLARPATAQTYTWDGAGGDQYWSDPANWVGNLAPFGNLNTAIINIAGLTGLTMNNDVNDPFLLNQLNFTSTAGAFNLSGGQFSFGGTAPQIANNSASDVTISDDITSTATSLLLTGTGLGNTTLSGTLSGTYGLNMTGSGRFILSKSNTFTGAVTISGGVLNIQNTTALGNAANAVTVNTGASLEFQSSTGLNVFQNSAITISGTGTNNGGAVRNVSGNNAVQYGGSTSPGFSLASDARINSDSGTLTVGNVDTYGHTVTLGGSGNITLLTTGGTGSVIKDGTGTVSAYHLNNTGTITINQGILAYIYTSNGNVTASSITVAQTGGEFDFDNMITNFNLFTTPLILNGTGVSNNGALHIYQPGNSITIGSPITLGSNSRIDADSDRPTFSTTLTGNITGTGDKLIFGGSTPILLSGVLNLGSTGAIGKDGTNTVNILTAFNSAFTGGVSVTSGTLDFGDTTSTSADPHAFTHGNAVTLNGVNNTAPGILQIAAASSSNSILNIGSLNVNGYGSIITDRTASSAGIISTNESTIPLTINGTLNWSVAGMVSTGTGTGNFVLSLGTTTLTGNSTFIPYGDSTTATNIRLGAVGDGGNAYSLTKNGGGNLRFDGANTYTGATIIDQGEVTVGLGSFSPTSAIQFNAGSSTVALLDIASQTQSVGSLATIGAAGTSTVALGSGTLTTGNDNTSTTYGGLLTGSGTLIKAGTGTQTLSGTSNTFTGNTTINGGTLSLTGNLGTGTLASLTSGGILMVNSGGKLAGTGQIRSNATGGAVVLNSGGTIAPGVGGIGTLSATSMLWNGGGAMNYDLNLSSASSDTINLSSFFEKGTSGTFNFVLNTSGLYTGPETYTLLTYTGNGGNAFNASDFTYSGLNSQLMGAFAYNAGALTFTVSSDATPEPSTLWLAGLGLLPATLYGRRRLAGLTTTSLTARRC